MCIKNAFNTVYANMFGKKKSALIYTSHPNKITQEVDFYIMEYILILQRCGFVSASMEEVEVI